jgi:hypothetical protein
MTGTDLDTTITSVTHLLGCDERYGTIDPTMRRMLETLLDESASEQKDRRAIAESNAPIGPNRY